MARSKSTSGGKTIKEQTSTGVAGGVPDVRANVQAVRRKQRLKPETEVTPEPRKKLEVVKTELRRVVPINVEDEIRRRAYELYQQRGAKPGSEREDWLAAEREVKQRYHQQQSA